MGGLVAIFGFVLAASREAWKDWRVRLRRDRALLNAAEGELAAMRAIVEANLSLVVEELGLLPRKQHLSAPLHPVDSAFWAGMEFDPPRTLLLERPALATMRDVVRRTDEVTELMRSRELFRIVNPALSQFTGRMMSFDGLLRDRYAELLDALAKLDLTLRRASARLDPWIVRLPES